MNNNSKVVCVCRRGQVRSIAARNILADRHGFRNVLTCGWENNSESTLRHLFDWADVVLIIGRGADWGYLSSSKVCLIEVGKDRWGRYDHPELLGLLAPQLEELIEGETPQFLTVTNKEGVRVNC